MRIWVGTIGTASALVFASSNVAFGEDIERPLGFLDMGDGDGEAEGGGGSDSIGCVWLRVGGLRSLPRSLSASFELSWSDTLSPTLGELPLASRCRRSLRLGFDA